MIYIGIDPGLDGALAVLAPTDEQNDPRAPFVQVFDTPTVTVKKSNGGNKREYDLAAMSKRLHALIAPLSYPDLPVRAAIEKVHAMPGQGVTSMFSMGYGCGLWEGLLAGLLIPYERVAPQRWQKLMLADEGKGKDAARLQAQRLFPIAAHLFARKKDDGRADALLIAEYGRRARA